MISRFPLQNRFPNNWNKVEYDGILHVLVEISEESDEYNTAVTPFKYRRDQIKKVLRVQHPIAFLRYTLHRENLIDQEKSSDEEVICYHPVTEINLNNALDYNCDLKMYTYGEDISFYTNTNDLDYLIHKIIIVIKKSATDDCCCDRHQYPLYLVLFEEIQSLKYIKLYI